MSVMFTLNIPCLFPIYSSDQTHLSWRAERRYRVLFVGKVVKDSKEMGRMHITTSEKRNHPTHQRI